MVPTTTAQTLTEQQVSAFRRDGYVHLPGVIDRAEAARFAEAALGARKRMSDLHPGAAFTQLVQVWRQDEVLRELTLHPGLGALASRLSGIPVRLWHDQLLIKEPRNGAATEFHQDQPYWPHRGQRHALSAWVALVDVPVERGCMTFIPGSHAHRGLRPQDLTDRGDLLGLVPELAWQPRVTVPLRAGDCTFHDSHLAHMATPNLTDDPRIAHVVIYVDAEAGYAADRPHVVTDPLDLVDGARLPDEHFPRFAG